jgi:hypothetical protein
MGEKEPNEWILEHWPKSGRNCNLGSCPAFKLTGQDMEYLDEAGKRLRKTGDIEKVIEELGLPSGMCKVTGREVVVNSDCGVSDTKFMNYYRNYGKGGTKK